MKLPGASTKLFLILGDILVLVLITISGFATHGELENLSRMPTTFIPLVISWFLIAPFYGLYNKKHISKLNQLWRVILAVVAAVPLAAWLRGIWLNLPIQPIFVLVIGGVCVLGMFLWRALYVGLIKWVGLPNG